MSIIATNGVMTKDAESFSIYEGIPAKNIAYRNKELNYEFSDVS